MTYEIISCPDESKAQSTLWGTFNCDRDKLFLFVSYLLNTTQPEQFWIVEKETSKLVRLTTFADHYGITKDDVKRA